jgi:hypothetical protein
VPEADDSAANNGNPGIDLLRHDCAAFASSQGARIQNVALLIGPQDHPHRLRMDRLDDRVRRRRQEPIDMVRAGDRLRLCASVAVERRLDASESGQRSIVVKREPNQVFFAWSRGAAPAQTRQECFRLTRRNWKRHLAMYRKTG